MNQPLPFGPHHPSSSGPGRRPDIPATFASAFMKSPVVGLRLSCVIFGLVCLAHIARVAVGIEIVVGHHRLGFTFSWICIIFSSGLAIWLSQLAGPWSGKSTEPDSVNFR